MQRQSSKKRTKGFFHSIAVLLHVNRFIRNIKQKSGHIGHIGPMQAKLVNDLCNDIISDGDEDTKATIVSTDNLILRMIVGILKLLKIL